MDEQTEWMDERPDDSPYELPPMTYKEMFSQIAAAFQTTMDAVVDAYKPIARAFQGTHVRGVYFDEITDFKEGEPKHDRMKELLEQKKQSNHGPRRGDPYNLRGRRNW